MTAETRRVEYESAEWRQLRDAGWCEELIYLPDDGGEVMALMRPTKPRVVTVEVPLKTPLEEIAADLEALGPTGSAS